MSSRQTVFLRSHRARLICALGLFILANVLFVPTGKAADWNVPGDGMTPTFQQYLDMNKTQAAAASHMATANAKGDLTYSFALDLPPAILKPAISIGYNSNAGWNKELPAGWTLGGLTEIRRPLARAYGADEWLLSGPAFDGTLKSDGSAYVLHGATPLLVKASYDSAADEWTVTAGGLTYELVAADDGAGTPGGTALWRVASVTDTTGNLIEYVYTSDGRLESFSYGGNSITGDASTVLVEFSYAANSYVHTSAAAGFVEDYAHHVEDITVKTRSGGTFARIAAYDLVYVAGDLVDLLQKITHEGQTASVSEVIAKFSYTEFDATAAPSRLGGVGAPPELGVVDFSGHGNSTSSTQTHGLTDHNGDGIPDFVDASVSGSWYVYGQEVDYATREFSFATAATAVGGEGWGQSETINEGGPTGQPDYVRTRKQTLDLNGDSFPDVISSDGTPSWEVRYGNGHSFGAAVVESAPWNYSRTGYVADADHFASWTRDTAQSLIDLNGDGWLDCYDPAAGEAWFHTGTAGGGWDATPTTVRGFDAFRNVQYFVDSESNEFDYGTACENACTDDYATCTGVCDEDYDECLVLCDPEECRNVCYEDEGDCETYCDVYYPMDPDCLSDCEDCVDECDAINEAECEVGCDDASAECNDVCETDQLDCESSCDRFVNDRNYYVSETFETAGFYDINGDGLSDRVDAAATPWQVYLGNGSDFEDAVAWQAPVTAITKTYEGYPEVNWESSDYGAYGSFSGRTSEVYQTLIDVDADGLLDLALGERSQLGTVWYKNSGSGFDLNPRALPSWWPDAFTTAGTTVDLDVDDGSTDGNTVTESVMMDLDHDGAVDEVSPTWVSYGNYPKPYLLKQIDNNQGGDSQFAYRSSNSVAPAGDLSIATDQHMAVARDLVDNVTTTDALTSQSGQTQYSYANGHHVDGVFKGFETTDESLFINSVWTSRTLFEYELGLDHEPLVTNQKIYADFGLSYGPTIQRSATPIPGLRFEVTNTYGDFGTLRLLDQSSKTEYGEVSGAKTVVLNYEWDDYGNLTFYSHDGGGDPEEEVKTILTYASDAGGLFYRVVQTMTDGYDPLQGTDRTFSTTRYYYDGNSSYAATLTDGLITQIDLLGGWSDGGEALEADVNVITLTRGPRSEILNATNAVTGLSIDQTYDFGSAVLASQTNNLGHVLTYAVDDRGRVTSKQDINGFAETTDYDDFGRVMATGIVGSTGLANVLTTTTYQRSVAPYYSQTSNLNDAGLAESTTYAVQNGLGQDAQSWRQNSLGNYLYANASYDVKGTLAATSHPINAGAAYFSRPFTITRPLARAYSDAMGVIREKTRDATKGTGAVLTYFDQPWESVHKDENGYLTHLYYDSHHRIIRVEQGDADAVTLMASYEYDPAGRMVRFTDARLNVYEYSYDGLGRLRQVNAGASLAATLPWYKYSYTGGLRTKMEDVSGAYAEWTYDAIERPLTLTVSDPVDPSGEVAYSWVYDTNWVGAVAEAVDPTGSTQYVYDDYGRAKQVLRNYATFPSQNFGFEFDVQGKPVKITLPSYNEVRKSYSYGWHTADAAYDMGGAFKYGLSYDYDDWGLLTHFHSSKGHDWNYVRSTPLWPDEIRMTHGATVYQRTYAHANNGLISSMNDGGPSVYSYSYDRLKELTQIKNGAAIVEEYSYDTAGNLTSFLDHTGATWTYSPAGGLNRVAGRTDGVQTDSYLYDTAGRMTDWVSGVTHREYAYDGLGRLRMVTVGGTVTEVLDYDAGNQIVRRADGHPFTGSPNFTYSFDSWRYDVATLTQTENETPFVATENGVRRWFFKEIDGHVAASVDDAGALVGARQLGAFGKEWAALGTPWQLNSYHGTEIEGAGELFAMGQRHLTQKDGQWLQPEPLLYLGIPQDKLAAPLSLAPYRYAMNNPITKSDTTGFSPSDPPDDAVPAKRRGYDPEKLARQAKLEQEARDIMKYQDWYREQFPDLDLLPEDEALKMADIARDEAKYGRQAVDTAREIAVTIASLEEGFFKDLKYLDELTQGSGHFTEIAYRVEAMVARMARNIDYIRELHERAKRSLPAELWSKYWDKAVAKVPQLATVSKKLSLIGEILGSQPMMAFDLMITTLPDPNNPVPLEEQYQYY